MHGSSEKILRKRTTFNGSDASCDMPGRRTVSSSSSDLSFYTPHRSFGGSPKSSGGGRSGAGISILIFDGSTSDAVPL